MSITRRTFGAALASALVPRSQAPRVENSASLVWTPESIAWQPDDPPGAKYAVLDGSRTDPAGVFSYAFWLPGGVWAPVHAHSQTAHVCVVKGTLRIGFGRQADRAAAIRIPAGQFFIVRAGQWHYEGSDDECVIIGTAKGGWTTTAL